MPNHKAKSQLKREYLGDGLYAEYDGFQLILVTNDGLRDINIVYLEPAIVARMLDYLRRVGMLK